METPQQKQLRDELGHKLVQELFTLRDALTRLSLTLHDINFERTVSQRKAAAQEAEDCIARSQSRQH
jgi:hypothetical protein